MGHRARMSGKVVEVWLAVVVLTGLLLAAPMAGTPVQGASADVVYASVTWGQPLISPTNSIGSLCVAQSGNGPDTQTYLHYAIYTMDGFHEGYGFIAHQDLKGSVKGRLHLDTHTSRISGGAVTGNSGAVNVIWQGDSVRGNIVGFDLAGASSFRGSAAASSLAAYCQ